MKKISQLSLIAMLVLIVACSPSKKPQEATEELKLPKVEGKEISYSADSLTMNGYIAYDANVEGKRPGILVVHEWWGHNDYARKRADMLAELGYVALAVDMYGDGKLAEHPEDAGTFMMEVISNIDGAKVRFESAMETLKANENVDADKIGAIGYCFGGSVVLSMANAGYDLDAVTAFHGGVGLPIWPEAGGVKGKILVCNGADDPFITSESVTKYKNKMDSAGADYRYVSYEGAVHSFTSKGADEIAKKFPQMPVAYNAAADSASWDEMKKLFEESF